MLSCPIACAARRLPSASRSAEALARSDHIDRAQQRVAAPERQPRLIEPSALDAFHRKGDRPAGADRVEAELVASL